MQGLINITANAQTRANGADLYLAGTHVVQEVVGASQPSVNGRTETFTSTANEASITLANAATVTAHGRNAAITITSITAGANTLPTSRYSLSGLIITFDPVISVAGQTITVTYNVGTYNNAPTATIDAPGIATPIAFNAAGYEQYRQSVNAIARGDYVEISG